ncbi:metallophosphoesterase [Gorillibacterium sp. sgz500922]|uniref:metallophosphoesterase n=1 Tax=Gorillibacterium sp. sgz500922 TaxID=3446694 RepID=UPI003F670931
MKRPFGLPIAFCGIVLALFLIAISGCTSGGSSSAVFPTVSPSGKSGSTDTLYLATDLHYLAPSLHDDGKAFQDYIAGGDSKLLNYSDELVEAWIAQVLRDRPRAVVLSGDITNNGEKASHQTLAKKLQTIKDAGIGVYVVPGNHDILNPWARSFKDDKQLVTDYITPQEFKTLYAPFGYEEAGAHDDSSLSYVAKLSDRLWLLMLDTCDYTYNVDNGAPETGGFLADSTLRWITEQGTAAKQAGANVIAVMHHNLLDHSDYSYLGFTITRSEKVLTTLKAAGIRLTLTGHIHVQDIRSQDGVTDIATGAFEVYPHSFGVLDYSPDASTAQYRTERTDVEAWAKTSGSKNPDLLHFAKYAEAFFRDSSYGKAYRSLDGKGYTEAQRQSMANTMAEINSHYFAGTTDRISSKVLNSEAMTLWKKAEPQFTKSYVLSMIENPKDNTRVTVSLSSER